MRKDVPKVLIFRVNMQSNMSFIDLGHSLFGRAHNFSVKGLVGSVNPYLQKGFLAESGPFRSW